MRESHYRIAGDYNLQINPPEEEPEPEVAIPKIEIAVGETTELTTELTTDSSSDRIPTDGSPIILYQILVQ